jgi:predicted Zn-dependent protease
VLPLIVVIGLGGRIHAGLIGTDQERKIGRQVADELERKYGLVREGNAVEKVREVGAKVAVYAKADRPKVDYRFGVLADPTINAVACPGGYMYAFRGLVKKMPEEEFLAAVLAHESAHVSERHGMQTLERTLGWSVLLGVLTGGQSDLGNVALGVLMNGYSRDQEAEADRVGHVYLYKAGYEVDAMARMLARLGELTEDSGGIPNFLRTHPSDATRVQAARKREAEILIDLGSEHPALNAPRLAVVYQPTGAETDEVRAVGEQVGTLLAQILQGSAQYHAQYAGARASDEAGRVSALAQLATEQGLDGAIGFAFTEPPLQTEGTGRDARVRIRLSTAMNVVAAGATQPEVTFAFETKEQKRDADQEKRIQEETKLQTEQTARALAVEVLRPTPVVTTEPKPED